MERSIIANRLKQARQQRGVSLREMARRLGLSASSAVVRIEDNHCVNERTIRRYADALDLDVEIRLVERKQEQANAE